MQNHGHKIVKCSCGVIMLQCRCMMENKPVEIIQDGCEECKAKPKQGECPVCHSSLEYDGYQMKDDSLCYSVSCPNNKCNWNGTEWYRTEYDNTADITGMPL